MLVIVDHFSHQIVAHDVQKTITVIDIVHLLNRTAAASGVPARLIVDHSTIYRNSVLVRWAAQHQAQVVFETPASPDAIGSVERAFQSLSSALATPPGHPRR